MVSTASSDCARARKRHGDWFIVAFCDYEWGVQVIATSKDVQRTGAWPMYLGYNQSDGYWRVVDSFLGTDYDLNMVDYENYTLLCWQVDTSYHRKLCFSFATPDNILLYDDNNPPSLSGIRGDVSLVVSHNTTFLAYGPGRICIETLYPQPIREEIVWLVGPVELPASISEDEIAYLRETCITAPALGFMQLEQGKHPMLVVAWTGTDAAHNLNIRLLSVDRENFAAEYYRELNYVGTP